MNFAGLKLSYIKKYAENHSLELQLGNEFRKDFLSSDLNLFNANNELLPFDKSAFINDIDYLQNTIFGQVKYSKKAKKWNYGFTILNQMIHSDLN